MEKPDQTMEQRVWQRVLDQPAQTQDPKGLLAASRELAAVYRKLKSSTSGKNRPILEKLWALEAENAACLRGICALQGINWKPGSFRPAPEPPRRALEKCYHRTRRAQGDYMARSAGGEFGEVYRALAERSGKQCVLLAEALGNL